MILRRAFQTTLVPAGAALLLACSGSVEPSASASASGGSSTTGSAGTSASSGAGGAGGDGATVSASGSTGSGGNGSVTTGAGGGDPCAGSYIEVHAPSGDPPPVFYLTTSCTNSWASSETPHAAGYDGYTGGVPGSLHETFLEACAESGPAHFTLLVPLFDVGVATTDSAVLQLSGVEWKSANGLQVTITEYGPVQGRIIGSFAGDMNGTFDVCRVSSFLPP